MEQLLGRIRQHANEWPYAWFRGEPDVKTRLTPKLYRPKTNRNRHNENQLLQHFRMKAPPSLLLVTYHRENRQTNGSSWPNM